MSVILTVVPLTKQAILPTRATPYSAGYDLYSAYEYIIAPNQNELIETDIRIRIPKGYYGQIASRSGLAYHHRILVGGGVIDSDYDGSIKVILFNFGTEPFHVHRGNRIAQLICPYIAHFRLVVVDHLPINKTRGLKGIGSTGV